MDDSDLTDSERYGIAYATPAHQIRAARRQCWKPHCPRIAWLEDWAGWHWCFRHWLFNLRWSGASAYGKWLNIRTVKIRKWY